jgi:hypothetical protein
MVPHRLQTLCGVRSIQHREPLYAASVPPSQPPADRCTPVVPDNSKRLLAEMICRSDDIRRKHIQIIAFRAPLGLSLRL